MADLLSLRSDHGLDEFLSSLTGHDAPDVAALWRCCDLPPDFDDAALLGDCFDGGEVTLIPALIPLLEQGGKTDQGAAEKLWRGNWAAAGVEELEILESVLLNGAGAKEPFSAKLGNFPTKALRSGACAALMGDLDELMSRVEAARPLRLALAQARRTLALQRFGHAFCTATRRRNWPGAGWISTT